MSLKSIATAAILSVASAATEWQAGACPEMDQNKSMETFNKMSMAGMWFEYVWDEGFSEDYGYECSTWLVLDDGKGSFLVYNHQQFAEEGSAGAFH